MTFLLLNLLQPQTRLSWVVIVAAALVFAGGVSLFVYFYKRYKRVERETEEDWDSARRSLFVNVPPVAAKTEEPAASTPVEDVIPASVDEVVQQRGTRAFASDMDLASFTPAPAVEPEPQVEPPVAEAPAQPEAAPEPKPRATEILASPGLVESVAETKTEPEAAFDEDVWADLEIPEAPHVVESEAGTLSASPEPLSAARVDQPSHREPFEAPSIVPLTPRETGATRELRSAPGIRQAEHAAEERAVRGTIRFGSASEEIPAPVEPSREGETRELAGDVVAAGAVIEPSIHATGSPGSRMFGSILGLPAEASHQPLILGEPVRSAEETGIAALTNYGQDLGPKGGRAGKIALLIVVALLAGAVGLYYFVPSVHSQVSSFIARLRGTQSQDRGVIKPKAQIIPSSRPEVNKNMVTAKGAVDNISDEPLEKLEVEVSLQRGDDAPPEIRRVPVTPDLLPPGERGTFEFEYDGKRGSGFAGYSITRLFANGTEVRFRTPAQK